MAACTPSSGPRGKPPFLDGRERTFFFILLPYLMHRFLVQSSLLTNMKKSLPQRS